MEREITYVTEVTPIATTDMERIATGGFNYSRNDRSILLGMLAFIRQHFLSEKFHNHQPEQELFRHVAGWCLSIRLLRTDKRGWDDPPPITKVKAVKDASVAATDLLNLLECKPKAKEVTPEKKHRKKVLIQAAVAVLVVIMFLSSVAVAQKYFAQPEQIKAPTQAQNKGEKS